MRADELSQIYSFHIKALFWVFFGLFGLDLIFLNGCTGMFWSIFVVVEIQNVSCGLLLLLFSTIQVKSV